MEIAELTLDQLRSAPVKAVVTWLDNELSRCRDVLERRDKTHEESMYLRGQIKSLKQLRAELTNRETS